MKAPYFLTAVFFYSVLATASFGAGRDWASVQSWVYQLCNYPNDRLDQIVASEYDLAVIDLTRDGEAGFFTQEEISKVKNSGKIVLAYFEIGAIEDYRPEWDNVPKELMVGRVNGWPKEQYVRFLG